ncbi:SA1362 family protein [Halalkalibacter akibai]|uniref:YqhP n=1 Tax=Halalkalibacter akibai (strain ATCC 43226 / DSM 21942 / CIP 109018 / JCM 9157 / 1139) TaxID=1236973 RepID=W4QW42_HALA3|nr:SA1362 family protein [Halalkalibacter akibai]GAE36326.1 hypothetical protein JCM9157_3487 [Halalkalibacter akibai JCM 9157]
MRSIMKYIVPGVLVLAFIGLGYELIFNPLGFLTRILMIVGFVALFFLIYRWFMSRRYGTPLFPSQSGPSRAQLQKAKRTSTQRHTSASPTTVLRPNKKITTVPKKRPVRVVKKRRENHNLTVIEGKKNKKKNRAFF